MFSDISLLVFVVLALASYRLTRLLVIDTIFEPMRDAIWSRFAPSHPVGYLFTCMWCMSIWVSSLLVLCYTIFSTVTLVFAMIFALSAVASLIAARWDD